MNPRGLKFLIERAWQLERQAQDGNWPEKDLAEFKRDLSLATEDDPHLSQLVHHLNGGMTIRHFQNFIVPLERALQRNPDDSQFVVTNQDSQKQRQTFPVELALDHWRSAFNVGSVFRTADALGIARLHLLGYTPTPEQEAVRKTSLGSHVGVPWSTHQRTELALQQLADQGLRVIALETSPQAVELGAPFEKSPTVFVLGNERFGLSPEVLRVCHEVRRIPLVGVKNSVNAAVCAALAVYEWKRQWSNG